MQNSRQALSAKSSKTKKNFKEPKKKSQPLPHASDSNSECNTNTERELSLKDCNGYAGIGSDSIRIYAEQTAFETLSEDVCSVLAEDINYKLEQIIQECLTKAKLLGKETITSADINECFESLGIERVYGAPSSPNWVPFTHDDQRLLYLDDSKVNLIDLAEDDTPFVQQSDAVVDKEWSTSDEDLDSNLISDTLKEYFRTVCECVISNDENIRHTALCDLSHNPSVGPILHCFYRFAYYLLIKDITYDCLTSRALHLLEVLENSPISNESVSDGTLKQLVKLILERLMISKLTLEVLRQMCYVLSVICLRPLLKEMAVMKIKQKIQEKCMSVFPSLVAVYYLGVDVVKEVFVPHINYFMEHSLIRDPDYRDIMLSIYGLMCKSDLHNFMIDKYMSKIYGTYLVPYWKPKSNSSHCTKKQPKETKFKLEISTLDTRMLKSRRKVYCMKTSTVIDIDEVFELPVAGRVKIKLDEQRTLSANTIRYQSTMLTIGKFSSRKAYSLPNCCDHSLLSYNI